MQIYTKKYILINVNKKNGTQTHTLIHLYTHFYTHIHTQIQKSHKKTVFLQYVKSDLAKVSWDSPQYAFCTQHCLADWRQHRKEDKLILDLILGDVAWTLFQDEAWVSLSDGLLLSVWAPALVHGSLGRAREPRRKDLLQEIPHR